MHNLPESVFFAQELLLLLLMALMQLQNVLYVQGIGWRSRISDLALTVCVLSSVCIIVYYECPTLKVVNNWYWEYTTGCKACNDEDSASKCLSGSLAGC